MQLHSMIHILLILLPLSINCNYPITLTTTDKTPVKINMNIDFGTAHILINSNKLNCDALDSCQWQDPNKKEETGTYNHEEYKYKSAYLTVLVDTENDEKKQMELKFYVRINNMFSILRMNNINAVTNYMSISHEIVIDLKKSTMIVQPMKKSDSNYIITHFFKL